MGVSGVLEMAHLYYVGLFVFVHSIFPNGVHQQSGCIRQRLNRFTFLTR